MKINTSDLTGPALDWAAAKCEGLIDARRVVVDFEYCSGDDPVRWEPVLDTYYSSAYAPSTDWSQGGPIIERERMTVEHFEDGSHSDGGAWLATWIEKPYFFEETGPTPLIAAMRCFVASRLGDEVNIPEELCN